MAVAPSTGVELAPFENLDRLLNVEMRIAKSPVGVVPRLYAKVRGERPLSLEVADALLRRPKAAIGFVTGIYLPPHFPKGEIDGPIGGLVMGAALSRLGYTTTLIMEQQVIDVTSSLVPIAHAEAVRFVDGGALDARGVERLAGELDLVITSERLGVNAKGVRHTINGTRAALMSSYPWPDELVNVMNRSEKLTIGIGDGGNEIGFGKIYDFAREIVPNGTRCRCDCADGIVTATATNLLFPVNVSNFGVYGILAAVAMLTNRRDLLHDPEVERSLLPAALGAGFVDGGTGLPEEAEDGIPGYGAVAFVTLLRALVENALRDFVRPF